MMMFTAQNVRFLNFQSLKMTMCHNDQIQGCIFMNFDVGLSSSSSAIQGENDECLQLFQYAIFHPCYISPLR